MVETCHFHDARTLSKLRLVNMYVAIDPERVSLFDGNGDTVMVIVVSMVSTMVSTRASMGTDIGKRIRQLRGDFGITQAGLASDLLVAKQTVHRWESGKTVVPEGRLLDIATLFRVPVQQLTGVPAQVPEHLVEAVNAKSGELLAWWGDIVVTFAGKAASIVRPISEHTYKSLRADSSKWLSFVDMRGRLVNVNMAHVERLILLDEADDRNALELLDKKYDEPAADWAGTALGMEQTSLDFDRTLHALGNAYYEWSEGLIKKLLELGPKEIEVLDTEERDLLDTVRELVDQFGVVHLEAAEKVMANVPEKNWQRFVGRSVDVHLATGLTRDVGFRDVDAVHAANMVTLEDNMNDGMYEDDLFLYGGDNGVEERIRWDRIAWIEGSALGLLEAHEEYLEDLRG